jgi:putative flippase GtrA
MSSRSRWIRFNLVGVAGFAVQLLTLAAATYLLGVPAGIAVPVAVFAAVTHNFLWHERVTWPGRSGPARWRRWLSFNAATGVTSIVVNTVITILVATITGVPLLAANAVAVAAASTLNFLLCDRVVFAGKR